jgi:plasmid maintenance system antidote protein VapI
MLFNHERHEKNERHERFARAAAKRINGGGRSITADTALRLARYFGNSPQFWLVVYLKN